MNMVEEFEGNKAGRDDENPDLTLDRAAASLENARALLKLKVSIGRSLRAAIRCLLEAQERLDSGGPTSTVRLDLLDAIRLVGSAEHELKGWGGGTAEEEALETQNRRAYPRVSASYPIQLESEHRVSKSDITQLPISGVTINVSRGGMLAKIDQGILRHGRYLVRFLEVRGSVRPEIMWGAVRRSRARNAGWEVGIEFDDPLDVLKK